MSSPVVISNLQETNSTSYSDVAGLLTGMDRIQGEATDQYVDRVKTALIEKRDHTYEGLINSIAFSLGLRVEPGIRITGPEDTVVTCTLGGLSLASGSQSLLFPLAVLGDDNVWDWNTLAQVVEAVNTSGVWQAELLSADGPAVQVCRQSNQSVGIPYDIVISEVGIIGLTEPSLEQLAVTPTGGLSYQMREFLQSIMKTDRSYWAR